MTYAQSLAHRVRRGEPIPFYIAALLSALTRVTRMGMQRRLRQPAARVPAYVISIGNLTVGGTGKTPAVAERARKELDEGRRVAILTRGYGAPSKEPCASPNIPREEWYTRLGDEPTMLLQMLPDLIVVKNADRVAGARQAMDEFDCSVLILDDGFQYTKLERDEDILVVDASNPFGTGDLLPRGILREPVEGAERATSIILTHCDRTKILDEVAATIDNLCPRIDVRRTRHAPSALRRLSDGTELPLDKLRGMNIEAACALANPEHFFDSLHRLGAKLTATHVYADHAPLPQSLLNSDRPLVITQKDAAKLSETSNPNLWCLEIELRDFRG